MFGVEMVKPIIVNVLSGFLSGLLDKMGKGLSDPVVLAKHSVEAQAKTVIARCKRETPTAQNMMYVKLTFPKDISEHQVMVLSDEALKTIMANVPADKYQYIRFGYERRGVVIKMRYRPRGCAWLSKES
ncbi:hypothetical protein VPHK469_0189 [Vibrio phage K469]